MNITLCTIGFAGKTAEEFFGLLQSAGVQRVVDIRENRGGQLSAFAKYPDIAFFLKHIAGIAYQHEPLLAPTPEIRKAYCASRDWAQYEAAFLDLMRQRSVPGCFAPANFASVTALLCSEPGPEKCHRRLVAELCADLWRAQGHTVEVRHLLSLSAKPVTGRKRTRSNDRVDSQ